MGPPTSWNDRSLLEHEPLLTYVFLYSEHNGSRHEGKQLVNRFVEEIQNNVCRIHQY